jgi:hypothetical protein
MEFPPRLSPYPARERQSTRKTPGNKERDESKSLEKGFTKGSNSSEKGNDGTDKKFPTRSTKTTQKARRKIVPRKAETTVGKEREAWSRSMRPFTAALS